MNIYISNLSPGITDDDLKTLFSEYGEVISATVIKDRDTGKSRGFGFVEMPDNNKAKTAIETLDNGDYDGQTIKVTEARPKADKPRGDFGNRGGGYNKERRDKRY